jgi:flagellar operon protein
MADPIRSIQNQPIQNGQPVSGSKPSLPVSGPSFADVLKKTEQGGGVSFSNHAQKRLERRSIQLTENDLQRLNSAIEKVEKRGGKDSVVLLDDNVFLVNVPEKLVITAVDAKSRGEGVFTNIDSVVIADPAEAKPQKTSSDMSDLMKRLAS